MTKTWKLEDAKTQFSRLIRDAEQETQIILRHGDLPTDKSVGFSGNACVDYRYVDA